MAFWTWARRCNPAPAVNRVVFLSHAAWCVMEMIARRLCVQFTLHSGLMHPSTSLQLAVPFIAKDVPSQTSEFSHPEVSLIGRCALFQQVYRPYCTFPPSSNRCASALRCWPTCTKGCVCLIVLRYSRASRRSSSSKEDLYANVQRTSSSSSGATTHPRLRRLLR
jgi:hypothetical protein